MQRSKVSTEIRSPKALAIARTYHPLGVASLLLEAVDELNTNLALPIKHPLPLWRGGPCNICKEPKEEISMAYLYLRPIFNQGLR